jgi:hypothetical protein
MHMTNIPIISSKIIGKQIVLSSRKQLRLQCSGTERIKWRPFVTQIWNCIDGDSFCMANNFAHEQFEGNSKQV